MGRSEFRERRGPNPARQHRENLRSMGLSRREIRLTSPQAITESVLRAEEHTKREELEERRGPTPGDHLIWNGIKVLAAVNVSLGAGVLTEIVIPNDGTLSGAATGITGAVFLRTYLTHRNNG